MTRTSGFHESPADPARGGELALVPRPLDLMAKTARRSPDAPRQDETLPPDVARVLERVAPIAEVNPDDLKGKTLWLDWLEQLDAAALSAIVQSFTVYRCDRGPREFASKAEWADRVPTEERILELHGPGRYVVRTQLRRAGRGGGWAPDVDVRIARPSQVGAAELPGISDNFARDVALRLIDRGDKYADRAIDATGMVAIQPAAVAGDDAIPSTMPRWVTKLVTTIQSGAKSDELPTWTLQLAELAQQLGLLRVTDVQAAGAGAPAAAGAMPRND